MLVPMLASTRVCETRAVDFGEQAASYVAEVVPSDLVGQQRTEVVCPNIRVLMSHRFPPQQVDALVQHFRTAGEVVVVGAFIVHGTHAIAISVTPDPCMFVRCPLDCSGDCGWDGVPRGGGSCRWGRTTDASDRMLSVHGCSQPPTSEPTAAPTGQPAVPTAAPTTPDPTPVPSGRPTSSPTPMPSLMPTITDITLPTIAIPFIGATLVAGAEAEASFMVQLLANIDARWREQGRMINLVGIRVLLTRNADGMSGLEAVLQFLATSNVDIALAADLAAVLADDPLSFTVRISTRCSLTRNTHL